VSMLRDNLLTTPELQQLGAKHYRFYNWLQAIQSDLESLPDIINEGDLLEVGGNKQFPSLPANKIGLLFLSSGTYEAAVVGGFDKWRRLYDGTTFDPSTNIP